MHLNQGCNIQTGQRPASFSGFSIYCEFILEISDVALVRKHVVTLTFAHLGKMLL